jgi:hypothetical protein
VITLISKNNSTQNTPTTIPNRQQGIAYIEELALDASLEETHQLDSKVTTYPVENGAVISDHIYNEPIHVIIKGIISSHPLPDSITRQGANAEDKNFVAHAWQYLLNIRDNRKPVTIVTGLRQYTTMVLTSLHSVNNYKTGGSLDFTAAFISIRIVNSKTVPVTYLKPIQHTHKKAAPHIDNGKQSTKPVEKSSQAYKYAKSFSQYLKTGGVNGTIPSF